MSEENAIVPVQQKVGMTRSGVELTSMDDAWRFATAIAGTDLAPKGMKIAEVFGVVQAGAELGLSPLRSLANMKIINGRVGPMGALAKALVRQAKVLRKGKGFKQWFTGTEGEDDWTAHVATWRADEDESQTTEFSVKDAKRATLWGKTGKFGPSPWVTYPQRMLMWRALGFHLDDHFSEVLMGFHISEVLGDYPVEVESAVMEPLDVPSKDPLLEELETTIAEMQPEETGVGGRDLHMPPSTGQAPVSTSPLSAVMAEKEAGAMTEEEAMGDLIRDGLLDVKDEDLADPDPDNKEAEGAEQEPML
jgi:hypothetical protein